MATKKLIRKDPEMKVETLLNVYQACNRFHLIGTTRAHVLKRFKDAQFSLLEWQRLFIEQRVI
jgi:hypothetical protein